MATSASADTRVINGSRCDCESCLGNVLDDGVIGLFAGGREPLGVLRCLPDVPEPGAGAAQRRAAQAGGSSAIAS